ncbi:hypothetical protein AAE02nite_22310 [Adhaeribacter aerolatus]|uniref:Uncharacterized protein n=1 Tax=Adhaeribacter aerolatus TaxID=670289 RepID=A0A512AYJ0_9BACT|nr:hypothetical protein [Adhaeribacter aerolatus]GEO04567.1 hypothetical protein AAE02nite_22310 [Adhaeribacter aerolatus]
MEVNSLKNILIQRIHDINDEAFLNALKVLTDAKIENDKYQLNQFEQEKVNKARQQYANGETFSQEDIKQEIDAWLKSA